MATREDAHGCIALRRERCDSISIDITHLQSGDCEHTFHYNQAVPFTRLGHGRFLDLICPFVAIGLGLKIDPCTGDGLGECKIEGGVVT